VEEAYFKKNLRPNSPEFFFITFHDFTTRASCSSVKHFPMEFMSCGMLRYLFRIVIAVEVVDVVAWFGKDFIVGFIETKLAFHCNVEPFPLHVFLVHLLSRIVKNISKTTFFFGLFVNRFG
ncbi:hypothetical protein V8G54_023148, partial [Vigna mungo]